MRIAFNPSEVGKRTNAISKPNLVSKNPGKLTRAWAKESREKKTHDTCGDASPGGRGKKKKKRKTGVAPLGAVNPDGQNSRKIKETRKPRF